MGGKGAKRKRMREKKMKEQKEKQNNSCDAHSVDVCIVNQIRKPDVCIGCVNYRG